MVAIPEVFIRRTRAVSIAYQLAMPAKVLENDPNRLWASVVCGQFDVDVAVTTNPLAEIGDPDTCVFRVDQGAVFFETYGTNEVYILGLPVGTPVAISTVVKEPRLDFPGGRRSMRRATRIETSCGNTDVTFGGGSAPFLAADPARRRVTVKVDSAFAALRVGADLAQLMPIAPFFPGFAAVEGTEALEFTDFSTGPTNAGWIMDREVPANG